MKTAVIDTSVVFKWYHHTDEDDIDGALLLRDAFLNGNLSLVVPNLLIYEFANAVRFRKKLGREEMAASVRSLWSLGLEIYPVDQTLCESRTRISYECGLSIYDATFVALAQQLSTTLVTADRALYKKAKSRHAVMLLAQVGSF